MVLATGLLKSGGARPNAAELVSLDLGHPCFSVGCRVWTWTQLVQPRSEMPFLPPEFELRGKAGFLSTADKLELTNVRLQALLDDTRSPPSPPPYFQQRSTAGLHKPHKEGMTTAMPIWYSKLRACRFCLVLRTISHALTSLPTHKGFLLESLLEFSREIS